MPTLTEYDVLYHRDISRRTEIAILKREPGKPWTIHYYMQGYGLTQGADEPGEVFEERKERDLERRIKEAWDRVRLYRWDAKREALPDHERVTRRNYRGSEHHISEHPIDCAVHDHNASDCNCHLAEERDECCGHTSDCAVHNEPAYPAGPCNCDMREDDAALRMTGRKVPRAIADPYPDHPTRADDHAERVLPHSEPWFRPALVKKGGTRA